MILDMLAKNELSDEASELINEKISLNTEVEDQKTILNEIYPNFLRKIKSKSKIQLEKDLVDIVSFFDLDENTHYKALEKLENFETKGIDYSVTLPLTKKKYCLNVSGNDLKKKKCTICLFYSKNG